MSDTQDKQSEEPAEVLQPTAQPDEVEQLESDEQPEVDTQDKQSEEPAEVLQPTAQPDEVEQLESDEQPEVDTQDKQSEEPAEEPAVDSKLKPFWVDGFGVVSAKSQADAEKRAKKIVAERRK